MHVSANTFIYRSVDLQRDHEAGNLVSTGSGMMIRGAALVWMFVAAMLAFQYQDLEGSVPGLRHLAEELSVDTSIEHI